MRPNWTLEAAGWLLQTLHLLKLLELVLHLGLKVEHLVLHLR
jgi:hypothetical protein